MLFDCISQLAEGRKYAEQLLCTEDIDTVVHAISSYQPVKE